MMRLLNKIILLSLFIFVSCEESLDQFSSDPLATGNNKPVVNRQVVIPIATNVEVRNGLFYIEGENFNLLSDIQVKKQDGSIVPTAIYRKTNDSLIAGVLGNINSVAEILVELILNSAQGQSVVPVSITISNGSVRTESLAIDAVTGDKIAHKTIPLSKISGVGANAGFIISYRDGEWRPTPPAGGGLGGGISIINLGRGLATTTDEQRVDSQVSTLKTTDDVLMYEDDGDSKVLNISETNILSLQVLLKIHLA